MKETEFKQRMLEAKQIGGDYGAGYQRGLRRHYHGEQFGTAAEHETWMTMSGHRQEQGDGYRDGFAGLKPNASWSPKTTAERVAEHDARLVSNGGRKLSGIRLTPDAAAALADLEAAGESATAAINRLLTESLASFKGS
jgi:hypothetical protein